MAARTLSAIIAELQPTYAPQVKSLQQQQSLVPNAVQADINEATAAKDTAFDDILGGARRRGMGFSGIPLGEQAKYASNVFAPTVLRAKTAGQERAMSLQDAILGITERRNTLAQQIRSGEVQQAEARRQFDLQYRLQQQQLAEQARASRAAQAAQASNNSWLDAFKQANSSNQKTGTGGARIPKGMQSLFNQVFLKPGGGEWDAGSLVSDYNATYKSAGYGNANDRRKLELYHLARPDLFGNSIPARVLANGSRLTY